MRRCSTHPRLLLWCHTLVCVHLF